MTTVPDDQFLSPEQLNQIPCVTSDRYLKAVPEKVEILQVCQDSNNPSLVIIDFALVGSYLFTPICRVVTNRPNKQIDSRRRSTTSPPPKTYANAPLVVGHPRNPDIPINTACGPFQGQLVFDFSEALPNFMSASSVEFELVMVGSIPSAFGVNFTAQSPSDTYIWDKGALPSPINLSYDRGILTAQFLYEGSKNCSCQIQCIIPSGISNNLNFCPDEIQEITIEQGDLTNDPFTLLLQVRDSVGNTSNINLQSLIGVKPNPPIAVIKENPKRVELTIKPQSIGGKAILDASYQIIKYTGTENAYTIWKDWSSHGWSFFVDTDITAGTKYGYAVRYKGQYEDISDYSDWAEVTF